MTLLIRSRRVRAVLASRRVRAWVRAGVGAGILLALLLQLGAGPFLTGLAAVSPPAIAAAVVLGAAATVAAAWRWRILAGRLGLRLGWAQAVTAYYRSQFLNSVLPGGVVGDVHRAVWHARGGGLAQASRAVAAERAAGQAVQLVLAAAVVVTLQRWAYAPTLGIVLLAIVAAGVGLTVAAAMNASARAAIRRELAHLAVAFGTVGTVARVAVASAVAVACHVTTFVIAALAVGVEAPLARLVVAGLIAVLAGAIPLSIGGWGPREGAAAWAFAAAGLGATAGIAASTAFGVLSLIAVMPGAAVVAASALGRRAGAHEAGASSRPPVEEFRVRS
ncbi:lysylphosphatidylglycerol synthase transmembrane domain-containing protein [Microbacterium sp. BWT-B31]|uniref:lysylphosphatidylglycerol synthase domain-containing protein n=1 Tax=Microbacterium sp. BWT-B31 TaxID=3232072 RepID=UPI003527FC76